MAIPERKDFLRPVLKAFSDGTPKRHKEAVVLVAKILNLTDEEAKQLAMHSTETLIEQRVAWAIFLLVRAGMLKKMGDNGFYSIAPSGLKALNSTKDINVLL